MENPIEEVREIADQLVEAQEQGELSANEGGHWSRAVDGLRKAEKALSKIRSFEKNGKPTI